MGGAREAGQETEITYWNLIILPKSRRGCCDEKEMFVSLLSVSHLRRENPISTVAVRVEACGAAIRMLFWNPWPRSGNLLWTICIAE